MRRMTYLSRPILVLVGMFMFGLMGCAQVASPPPRQAAWRSPPPPYHVTRRTAPTCAPHRRYRQVGLASWYGRPYHGRRTASGRIYNMYDFTAAHRSLPFGSRIRVTNLRNGRSVVLTVNDRGPTVGGRIVDVSYRAAQVLHFVRAGVTRVELDRIWAC